jgi:hypothetical protein
MVEITRAPPPSVAKVLAVVTAMCLVTVGVYHGSTSRPVEMFSEDGTPDLKTLLGNFMKEQGAKPSDIKEMEQYYSGDKAPVQMLDDVSSEFDPIEDYDSNYARALGVREPSRTNGFVPEDMDVSPERKAPVQMLDDISSEFDPIEDADSNYARTLGVREPSRTNGVVPEDMDASPERKAPVEMLFDVDGPQPTDGSRASWLAAGVPDRSPQSQEESLGAKIRAGWPKAF